MFVAPFHVDPAQRVVAPLAVQYAFEASPKWHAENPGAIDAVGGLLLQMFTVQIHSWLAGARHNARMSSLPIWRSRYTLPGITGEYTRAHGYESLRIIAQPENASGRIATTLTIKPGETIDVEADFHDWPIPGYPADAVNITSTTNYWWDFASTPGAPGLDRPIDQFGDGNTPWPAIDWRAIEAGSHIIPTALDGQIYWEVEIVALPPGDTPGAVTYSPGDPGTPGTTSSSPVRDTAGSSATRKFPTELSTWLSPSIGVIPEVSLAKSSDGRSYKTTTPTMMGLEQDGTGVGGRAVFVTRASFAHYITTTVTYVDGFITIHDVAQGHTFQGARFYYQNTGTSFVGAIYDPKSPPFIDWSNTTGFLLAKDGVVWQAIGPLFGGGGSTFDYFDPRTQRTLQMGQAGTIGGSFACYTDSSATATTTSGPVDLTAPTSINSDDSPGVDYGDTMLVLNGNAPNPGEYAPILQGRADSDGGPVGMGVDTLRVGDIIMIAVDTTVTDFVTGGGDGGPQPVSGLIYFGKNGLWSKFNADKAPWQSDSGKTLDLANDWASWLDPELSDANPDGPVNYYPAVSWRVGHVKLRFRLGTSCKYPPPKGFTVLTQGATDITVPGPDKPK